MDRYNNDKAPADFRTPYLIQRAEQITDGSRDELKGVNQIVDCDYMGSSEFEWGALPKSLKEIREDIQDYVYQEIMVNDKKITLFANKKYADWIHRRVLPQLAAGNMRLKEFSGFDMQFMTGERYDRARKRYNFWWDIDNHYMFWVENNPEFTKRFKKLILG